MVRRFFLYRPGVFVVLLGIVIVLFPFSLRLTNIAIVVTFGFWFFTAIFNHREFNWKNLLMWAMVTYYVILALSLFYTSDIKRGIHILDKSVPLVMISLVIGSQPDLGTNRIRLLLRLAMGSLVTLLIICFGAATYRSFAGLPGGFYWVDLIEPVTSFHPTYLSLYVNFFIGWIMVSWLRADGPVPSKRKLFYSFLLVFFYVFQVLLSSKIQIGLAFLIPALVLVLYWRKVSWRYILPIGAGALAVLFVVIRNTKTWERFENIMSYEYALNAPVHTFNELTIRLALSECAWTVIREHPGLGVGAGDVSEELDKVFRKADFKFGYIDNLNPHNQYLSTWLATGLVGVAVLMSTLVVASVNALRWKRYELLLFLFLISLSFLTESVLERQKGIVLFSYLLPLLFWNDRGNRAHADVSL